MSGAAQWTPVQENSASAWTPVQEVGDEELARFKAEHPDYKGPVSKMDTSDHSSDPDMQAVLKFKADHPFVYGALHGLYSDQIPLAPLPMELPASGASLVGRAWDALKSTVGDPAVRDKAFKAFIPHGKELLEWKDAVGKAVSQAATAIPDEEAAALNQIAKNLGADSFESLSPAQQTVVRGLAARAKDSLAGTAAIKPAPPADPNFPRIDIGEPVRPASVAAPITRGPLRPPLNPAPPTDIPSAPPASGPVTPVRPPLQAAPPAAYMDTESSGLGVPQLISNRARAAGNIARKLSEQGVTQADLDALDQVPAAKAAFWENAGKLHRDGYVPSKDTIDAVKDLLPTGKPGPVLVPDSEIPAYLARNPKALAAAKALKASSIGELMTQTGK